MSVVVLGSLNMDLVVRTPRLPRAGETLAAHAFFTAPGGKGANQAVACARLGVPTHMIGRVGGDMFGAALLDSLRQSGVDVGGVLVDPAHSSGVALISVDDRAENSILIVAGANGAVGPDDLERLKPLLEGAAALLLQLEVPLESVVAAARLAHERGVPVILDPAPARPLPPALLALTDVLTPNETEAAALVGFPLDSPETAAAAARALAAHGARRVIIKLGGQGAYIWEAGAGWLQPPFKVQAVDTVAAGDAFNGGLAAALAEGRPFPEAVRWAAAAGALAVTKPGAQPAMPERAALDRFLQTNT